MNLWICSQANSLRCSSAYELEVEEGDLFNVESDNRTIVSAA